MFKDEIQSHQLSTQQKNRIFSDQKKERLRDSKIMHESIISCQGTQLEAGRAVIRPPLLIFMLDPTAYILHNN